jgi:hypothetical protein
MILNSVAYLRECSRSSIEIAFKCEQQFVRVFIDRGGSWSYGLVGL